MIKTHDHEVYLDEDNPSQKTKYLLTHPKTIVNKINSPDIKMNYGVNPYQGCEHGCVYCYARNTHPYWGYSAGLEFESVIMVKASAPALLAKKLSSKSWKGDPIMFSGNTDCYQPIERKYKLTRQMLELCLTHKNPVGIITKNSLLLRDLDIIEEMNQDQLVMVSVSLNTLDDAFRQKLEPRASSVKTRLLLIEKLCEAGIPVNVMFSPVIPGLNDHEVFSFIKTIADLGASSAKYIMVRLNADVKTIFEDWLTKTFPNKKKKVMNLIAAAHGGKHSDSRFKTRMRGEGKYVESINQQFHIAMKKYMHDRQMPELNQSLFRRYKGGQLDLF